MFESLQEGLQSAFKTLRGKGKLTESNMREGLQMVEQAFIEADVSYTVTRSFMDEVTNKALGQKVLLALKPHEELMKIVYEELVQILGPVDVSIPIKKDDVTILMMCGLQGAGKTTTCGKLAQLLKEKQVKPFLVAADLQRPAAIEQLHVIGRQLVSKSIANWVRRTRCRSAATAWPKPKRLVHRSSSWTRPVDWRSMPS